MEGYVFFILIPLGIGMATALVAALTEITSGLLAKIGVGAGVLVWLVLAITIFRGPDNPELGETGWTILVGLVIATWVGAWLVAIAAGRLLRRTILKQRARTAAARWH